MSLVSFFSSCSRMFLNMNSTVITTNVTIVCCMISFVCCLPLSFLPSPLFLKCVSVCVYMLFYQHWYCFRGAYGCLTLQGNIGDTITRPFVTCCASFETNIPTIKSCRWIFKRSWGPFLRGSIGISHLVSRDCYAYAFILPFDGAMKCHDWFDISRPAPWDC